MQSDFNGYVFQLKQIKVYMILDGWEKMIHKREGKALWNSTKVWTTKTQQEKKKVKYL